MSTQSLHAPAKVNLFLAITGRRPDGYHELISVVAPVEFGDTLHVELRPDAGAEGAFELTCDDATVPTDGSNLVLKAARAFAVATGWGGGARFFLEKRIPMGAGLGGGSSDAVAALRLLNEYTGGRLGATQMAAIAAELGSDCPLFLQGGPVLVRGRGERVERLAAEPAARLARRRVLVFKPGFGISTPWAFGRMAETRTGYVSATEAEGRWTSWADRADARIDELFFNSMEGVAFAKFVALPAMRDVLRDRFGVVAQMSGSGSACYVPLADDAPVVAMTEAIREAWGESAFVVETRFAEIVR